jgi:hypothetical protein
MTTMPKYETLVEEKSRFVLGDGWSQQRSLPIIVGIQPKWEERRPSDLGGVRLPLVWDIG